jgi:pimeloyl-ACP methyl ester carboxylesterase
MGAVGKKILKVLAFKLIDAAAGAAAQLFASRWENDRRTHRLRGFAGDSYGRGDVGDLTDDEIRALAGGPALMFVHGTMSVTHGAFHRLPKDAVAALHEAYSGRVFAFDHPTVSVTPTENARWLGTRLRDANLTVDVLAHSRGGLVARVLAEQPAAAGITPNELTVRNLVMVATPNAGTALAHKKHLGELVDTWTNLLELVPDNAVTDVLAIVVSVVKQLAVGALGGLDGLMSMNPDGDYLKGFLNGPGAPGFDGSGGKYVAVAADFEPAVGSSLGRFARDRVTDAVFEGAPNDLVVPRDGVFGANGSPRFPIENPVQIGAADAIDHSSYWVSDPALKLFAEALTA